MKFFDVVLAQTLPTITPLDKDTFKSVGDLLLFIIRGLLFIAGALAVIYIIWSGYVYITSAGDPERAQKGRNGLIYAIIGVVIIALSFAIVNVVGKTLKEGFPSGQSGSSGAGTTEQPKSAEQSQTPTLEGPAQQRFPGTEGPL